MNAGDVDKACKSKGFRRKFKPLADEVGIRRNVPKVGHNQPKGWIIPDGPST